MKNILYFLAGTALGAGAMYVICNSLYKEKLNKQSNDIYNYYAEKYGKQEEVPEKKYTELNTAPKAPVKPDISTVIQRYNAISSEVEQPVDVKKEQAAKRFGPYVIPALVAGSDNGDGIPYEIDGTYDYWANDVLTDASGRPLSIEEIDQKVGADFADHLGEVDDSNTTYFRNEELRVDFEIYDNGDEEYRDPTTYVREDD